MLKLKRKFYMTAIISALSLALIVSLLMAVFIMSKPFIPQQDHGFLRVQNMVKIHQNLEISGLFYLTAPSQDRFSMFRGQFTSFQDIAFAISEGRFNENLGGKREQKIRPIIDLLGENHVLFEAQEAMKTQSVMLFLTKLHTAMTPFYEYSENISEDQNKNIQDLRTHLITMLFISAGLSALALLMVLYAFSSGKVLTTVSHRQKGEEDEDQLSAQQKLDRTHLALETLNEGLIIVDRDGLIEYANPVTAKILNGDASHYTTFLGRTWYSIFKLNKAIDLQEELEEALQATSEGASAQLQFEIVLDSNIETARGQRKSESLIDVCLYVSTMRGGSRAMILRDMRETLQAEKESNELRKQFFQAQKMESIGRMAGGIAHDFNNILSAIMGYAEFLQEDLPQDSDEQEFAKKITTASKQARQLIAQMMSFSRKNDGEKMPVDIVHLLQVSHDMVRSSAPHSLDIKLYKNIDQFDSFANPTEISQVLMNLCVNARDAMEGEKGVLSLSVDTMGALSDQDEVYFAADQSKQTKTQIVNVNDRHTVVYSGALDPEENYAIITIEDNGTGILPAIMEQIFEPFFTTKDQDKGTGLGLSSVLGIILSHKAAMKVESVIGSGTSFKLYFACYDMSDAQDVEDEAIIAPMHEAFEHDADEDDVEDQDDKFDFDPSDFEEFDALDLPEETSSSAAINTEIMSHPHIVLVDDDNALRDTVCAMLKRGGYENVQAFEKPLEALEYIKENTQNIQLMITDYRMPKMKGNELVKEVEKAAPHIPVLMISGFSDHGFEETLADYPTIQHFLHKPLEKQDFLEHVRITLESNA